MKDNMAYEALQKLVNACNARDGCLLSPFRQFDAMQGKYEQALREAQMVLKELSEGK